MSAQSALSIPETLRGAIFTQAEQEYPHECCGMVLGPKSEPEICSRIRPCENVYDLFHAKDPDNFPRTAKTAYFIHPKELLLIEKELRERNEAVRVIYHSHIDTEAFFSSEDQKVAVIDGMPAYPGVQHLVISVKEGKQKESNLFVWNDEERKYVSCEGN